MTKKNGEKKKIRKENEKIKHAKQVYNAKPNMAITFLQKFNCEAYDLIIK